jgi:hypothetical protein
MRKVRFALATLLVLSAVPFQSVAQEVPKPEPKKPATLLKIQVIFAENEGEKKLANLPYIFFLKTADSSSLPAPWTKVRVGSRVPVYAGKDGGMQYIDVGTNIDARGFPSDDGRFDIYLNLERSWVEGDVLIATEKSASSVGEQGPGHFKEPVIRQFKTELNLTMHDGQTIQTTQAADPLSGRVLTITVTMNVVK